MARGPGKGNTNNPAGKPAGTKNTKTKQWEALGAKIVGEGAERFMSILDGLDDDAFTKNYLMILEYFKPKQQRTELKAEVKNQLDLSSLSTDELKERAKAIKELYDSSTTDTA